MINKDVKDIVANNSVKKILDCNAKVRMQTDCIGSSVLLKNINAENNVALNDKYVEFITDISGKLDGFMAAYAE